MFNSKVLRVWASVLERIVCPVQSPALLIRIVGVPIVVRIEGAMAAIELDEVMSQWK